LSIGEKSFLNRAFRKFNLSSLKNAVPCLPSLVGNTQSKISKPFATAKEISLAVSKGFDIFDCVLPTRLGRHGTAFFNDERLNLRNARFKNDFSPIDKTCTCETCKSYSRAYLHHLIRNDEILGLTLISLHNIAHLIRFTSAISNAIKDNCFTIDFAPWKTSSIAHHTW
jgi:queuine tRNA-ribosyltransferase